MLDRLRESLTGRVMLVGIGNRLRGDDGLGSELIARLRGRVEVELLDCGEVPERYFGLIEEARPESILLIDAVDLSAEPGAAALFEAYELPDRMGTTHNVPLSVLAGYLAEQTGAKVMLLAVQPQSTALQTLLSPRVERTLDALMEIISQWDEGRPKACKEMVQPVVHTAGGAN